MATSSISPAFLRPSMLLISICTTVLSLTACKTDSTESASAQSASIHAALATSDSGQIITKSTPATADSSATLNHSASAMSMRAMPTSQYLVGSSKADITGAAAETGMSGYAAGQVVQGINDRLYSHAFIIGEADKNADKRVVYVSADMGAMFTAVKLKVIKRPKADYGDLCNDDNVMLTATHTHVGNAGYSHQQLYQIASTDDTLAGYSS